MNNANYISSLVQFNLSSGKIYTLCVSIKLQSLYYKVI